MAHRRDGQVDAVLGQHRDAVRRVDARRTRPRRRACRRCPRDIDLVALPHLVRCGCRTADNDRARRCGCARRTGCGPGGRASAACRRPAAWRAPPASSRASAASGDCRPAGRAAATMAQQTGRKRTHRAAREHARRPDISAERPGCCRSRRCAFRRRHKGRSDGSSGRPRAAKHVLRHHARASRRNIDQTLSDDPQRKARRARRSGATGRDRRSHYG